MTLILDKLSHAYGDHQTLCELSLSIAEGEVVSLLGPSGCGKTTLLRLVAGLERLKAGSIELDGALLASAEHHPSPEARPVGLVFQEHALFPNMSVAENIEFGLVHLTRAERVSRRKGLLDMVGLAGLDGRKPGTLSGGQQQRVALARALAPAPRVMLLDEPYASVDVMLRRELREAARMLLKNAGSASLLVTHDPDEALEMSDRIAVMSEGRILQAGKPDDIINQPNSSGVACLFGEAQMFEGRIQDGQFMTSLGVFDLGMQADQVPGNECLDLVVRPSGLRFVEDIKGDWLVRDVRYRSSGRVLFVSVENAPAFALIRVDADQGALPGEGVRGRLELRSRNAFLFAKTPR